MGRCGCVVTFRIFLMTENLWTSSIWCEIWSSGFFGTKKTSTNQQKTRKTCKPITFWRQILLAGRLISLFGVSGYLFSAFYFCLIFCFGHFVAYFSYQWICLKIGYLSVCNLWPFMQNINFTKFSGPTGCPTLPLYVSSMLRPEYHFCACFSAF